MEKIFETLPRLVAGSIFVVAAALAWGVELARPEPPAGVEFVNDRTVAIGANDTTVGAIDVRAPAAGFLVATSMGSASCTNAATLLVRLHNRTTAVSTSAALGENRPLAGQTGYYYINYVFAVNPGTSTLTVTGSCTNGGGSMTALTFNAIFVPARY